MAIKSVNNREIQVTTSKMDIIPQMFSSVPRQNFGIPLKTAIYLKDYARQDFCPEYRFAQARRD